MLLSGGSLSSCNAAVGPGHGNPGLILRRSSPDEFRCVRSRRTRSLRMASVAAGEPNSKPLQESSHQPNLANRLRLGSLTEDGSSYKEKFIIRCFEVGLNKTATVETIANLLQEVGCNHLQSVGILTDGYATTTTMRKLHLILVNTRVHIEMYKYPSWGDVVEIETWCQDEGSVYTRRDWILHDFATGEVFGRATSKVVMLNQDTRRLQKFNNDIHEECRVLFSSAGRLVFPEENHASLKKITKLEDPAKYSKVGLVPRRADLDMNQHVNYVTYIGWVLESMPQEIIDSHELRVITLDFRRECQQDDVVDAHTTPEGTHGTTDGSLAVAKDENDPLQFLHSLRLSNGSEITKGRTEWIRKPYK